MKQIFITKTGGAEVLKVKESTDPEPTENTVRIRVKASGINFADILARQGVYPDAPPLPAVVGYEVSGVVDAVGKDVPDSWIGKEVIALTRFGGYSDTVITPIGRVFEKPASLSFEQAASIPVVYLTAWQLIVIQGGLRKGQTILIQNAGGGVGLAAIDIAKHIGAISIGTASARKKDFLLERGLNHFVDYRPPNDWVADVKKITNNKGVDLIIDPLGPKSWNLGYSVLRSTGRIGFFGASTLSESSGGGGFLGKAGRLASFVIKLSRYGPLGLMDDNKGVFGVNLGHMWHEEELIGSWLREILEGVEAGWIHPYVDSSFSFEEAGTAQSKLEKRENIGKVILVPTKEAKKDEEKVEKLAEETEKGEPANKDDAVEAAEEEDKQTETA